MLAISVRERPCSDFDSRSSSGRETAMTPSSCATVIGSVTTGVGVPCGPFAVALWPSMLTPPPEGTGRGRFPIRDISPPPGVGEVFPACPTLGCLLVGQQPVGRRNDRDAEATEHARETGRLRV